MGGIPRSPGEDGKYDNDSRNDKTERSAAYRGFPVLTILHAHAPITSGGNAVVDVMVPCRRLIVKMACASSAKRGRGSGTQTSDISTCAARRERTERPANAE